MTEGDVQASWATDADLHLPDLINEDGELAQIKFNFTLKYRFFLIFTVQCHCYTHQIIIVCKSCIKYIICVPIKQILKYITKLPCFVQTGTIRCESLNTIFTDKHI